MSNIPTLQPVAYEEHKWNSTINPDMLTRRQRESIVKSYKSAVPQKITELDFTVSSDLQAQIDDALIMATRFDEMLSNKPYDIPSIMLRSESASSSQIENLTASARNVAIAQIDEKAPLNSRIIAANITAMQKALSVDGDISVEAIKAIHKALMSNANPEIAGQIRNEQVWIGGSGLSPSPDALFIPPYHTLVSEYLEDFSRFANRYNLNPVVIAAVSHAQFETIHPVGDGNGRTGRAILQKILKNSNVLKHSSLPISVGLLHKVNDYFSALNSYRLGGYIPMVQIMADSILFAVQISSVMVEQIDNVLQSWGDKITARRDANIWRLINLVVENPVVDYKFIQQKLGVSERTVFNLVDEAEKYGILKNIGKKRGMSVKFEATEITKLIDEVVNNKNMFRNYLGSGTTTAK
ncbi:MAG: Fic family protein [Candidatus Ancillula sp.]|jgi:Fic family protein|nr:Fic family protein [Candidatus Ancillula sp.]